MIAIRELHDTAGVIEIVREPVPARGAIVQEEINVRRFRPERAAEPRERRGPPRIEHAQSPAPALREFLPRRALHRILPRPCDGSAKERIYQRGAVRRAVAEQHEARRTLEQKERLDRRDLPEDRCAQTLGQTLHQTLEFFVDGEEEGLFQGREGGNAEECARGAAAWRVKRNNGHFDRSRGGPMGGA